MSGSSSRPRLQATAEALAKKRQKEFEDYSKWNDQTHYYKNWNQQNSRFQNWTSSEYYNTSLDQYKQLKQKQSKEKRNEERRSKLQKLYFEEEQQYDLEISQSPRDRASTHRKLNDIPTELLQQVNSSMKQAEEAKKRQEAELKLYDQWKQNNPIVRDYERNHNQASLKLAWLDQQIEKKMKEEKEKEELDKLLEEREQRLKQQEEINKQEMEQQAKYEAEILQTLELQMKEFSLKGMDAQRLKNEEIQTVKKREELEELLSRRNEANRLRKNKEIALFNLNQAKIKLRQKSSEIEEQLKEERRFIEDIMTQDYLQQIEYEDKQKEINNMLQDYNKLLIEQQNIEDQRQKCISSIFDSEARQFWEKQDRLWSSEQAAREKLFQQVTDDLKSQISAKLAKNLQHQQEVLEERQTMLQQIEEHDAKIKAKMDEYKQKQMQRKQELDKQIEDKKVLKIKEERDEKRRKLEELENIRREEEKIKTEIMKIQQRQYPNQQSRFRRIFW